MWLVAVAESEALRDPLKAYGVAGTHGTAPPAR